MKLFIDRPGPSGIAADQESFSARIVVFDSECNLCTGAARFIEHRDHSGSIRLIASYSPEGKNLLRERGVEDPSADSVVVVEGSRVYLRSEAVIRILASLGGPWRLAILGLICPRLVRDWFYDLVARSRSCLLPEKSDAGR